MATMPPVVNGGAVTIERSGSVTENYGGQSLNDSEDSFINGERHLCFVIADTRARGCKLVHK